MGCYLEKGCDGEEVVARDAEADSRIGAACQLGVMRRCYRKDKACFQGRKSVK